MNKLVLNSYKKNAYRMVVVQVVVAICASIIATIFSNKQAGEALFVGSAIYIIPGAFYAAQLFANLSSHAVKRIIVVFYLGEVLKLFVSVGAFVAVFSVFSLPLIPYFVGYVIAAVSFCVAPLFVMPAPKNRRVMY